MHSTSFLPMVGEKLQLAKFPPWKAQTPCQPLQDTRKGHGLWFRQGGKSAGRQAGALLAYANPSLPFQELWKDFGQL